MKANLSARVAAMLARVEKRRAERLSHSLYALAIAAFILDLWLGWLPLFLISTSAILAGTTLGFRGMGWPDDR